MLKDMNY